MRENAINILKKHSIKPSLQRIEVMLYLLNHRTHPSIDEIYADLQSLIPTLSKTTVYTTTKLLVEKGAVSAIGIEEKNLRYDAHTKPHAHFICLGCNCIYDLEIKEMEAICHKKIENLTISDVQLYYKGYCKECLEIKISQQLKNKIK